MRTWSAALAWVAWLNGGASLLLLAFGLGIVGADIAPPDDLPLMLLCFAAGTLAAALTFVLFGLVRGGRAGAQDRVGLMRLAGLLLGLFGFLVAVLAFLLGCWWGVTGGWPGVAEGTLTVWR